MLYAYRASIFSCGGYYKFKIYHLVFEQHVILRREEMADDYECKKT